MGEVSRILGIDPGIAKLGYAVIDTEAKLSQIKLLSCGIIKTEKTASDSERLAEIRRDLSIIFDEYQPDIIAVEKLFFFKNPKTIIPVAEARGVVLELAGSYSRPVFELTPLQVKQILTGQGRADKKLVADLVRMELGMEDNIKPDDAADAVAIAICYLRLR